VAALDVGTKHIGLAVSDEGRVVATPWTTIERTGAARNSEVAVGMLGSKLQRVISELQIDGLVVGLPIHEGKPTPLSREIVQLMLHTRCFNPKNKDQDMIFTLWNEHSSSMEARRVSKSLGSRTGAFHKHKDEMAAAVILRSFFDSNK